MAGGASVPGDDKKLEPKCSRCGSSDLEYLGRAIVRYREVFMMRCKRCGHLMGFNPEIYEEPKEEGKEEGV